MVAVLTGAPQGGADAPTPGPEASERCTTFVEVLGLGAACPSDGGWTVALDDGSTVFTHGPDRFGLDVPALDGFVPALPPTPLAFPPTACVANAAVDFHGLLLYARPVNKQNRYEILAPVLRAHLAAANAILLTEAAEFGAVANYRMRCTDGVVDVANAVLPTPSNADSFGTIVNDLKNQGHNRVNAKYWIWYDDTIPCGCSGIGTINIDDRLLLGNANNVGPDYGATFATTFALTNSYHVMMHENGHNLGAVQLTSPNTSGAFHCNDGQDIMCYDDGGPGVYDPDVCPVKTHFDCNHDDYFRPNPPAGNYLANHWNLASPLNRFVKIGA